MATFAPVPVSEEPRDAQPQPRRVYLRYLAIVVLIPILALFSAFPIARTTLFERVSPRMFWHAMDYHVRMAGQRCDVVIYGDSTALTGIDPLIFKQLTGLQACNLAMPYMALSTTGTWTLDHFLANSPAPRAIVFAFHPRHLREPQIDEDSGIVEGWLMVDRVRPVREALRYFLAHGRQSMIFAESVWQEVFTINYNLIDPTGRSYKHDMQVLREHSGYLPIREAQSVDQICGPVADPVKPLDANYLPALLRRYETPGTRAFVYITPVRACDEHIPEYNALAHRLGLTPPLIYPATDFADGNHLLPSSARRATIDFATMLRQRDPELMQSARR